MQDYADVVVKPPLLFLGAIALGCLFSWIVPLGPGLGSANARALATGGALRWSDLPCSCVSVREFRRAGTSVVPGRAFDGPAQQRSLPLHAEPDLYQLRHLLFRFGDHADERLDASATDPSADRLAAWRGRARGSLSAVDSATLANSARVPRSANISSCPPCRRPPRWPV